jgi:hypothetical protein
VIAIVGDYNFSPLVWVWNFLRLNIGLEILSIFVGTTRTLANTTVRRE